MPQGHYQNFVTGFWVSGQHRAEVWGRPAALAVSKDGALLIADDTGGTIWRISYSGPKQQTGQPASMTGNRNERLALCLACDEQDRPRAAIRAAILLGLTQAKSPRLGANSCPPVRTYPGLVLECQPIEVLDIEQSAPSPTRDSLSPCELNGAAKVMEMKSWNYADALEPTVGVMSVTTAADHALPARPSDVGPRPAARKRGVRAGLRELRSRSRRVISEHRHKRRQRDREVSDQSRRGLDWTNFFMADVQIGFGSFLAFFLADLGWSKQNVGLALTVGGLAGVLFLIPGGALTDALRWKRGLVGVGIVAIAMAALILALRPSVPFVFAAEVLHGIASGFLAPAIAAISLGLAGRHGMSCRIGRNFRFAAAGNALTAAAMGALGAYFSNRAIFFVSVLLCLPALFALSRIRPEEIDYIRARNATKQDQAFSPQRLTDLGKNWKLLLFAGCLVLFHLGNAPLLPLVSENLAHHKLPLSPLFMAGLLIVPQIVVSILAPWVGYWSELWGRKPLLLAGFLTEAARALLFAFVSDPRLMIAIQVLDGITGAIVTVVTILVITDLTTGSGRFNLAQGVLGAVMAGAAALGTGALGIIVEHFGDLVGFLTMAAQVLAGAALLWLCMPESKPERYVD